MATLLFSSFLALAGAAFAMQIADLAWVREYHWLKGVLWAGSAISLVAAIVAHTVRKKSAAGIQQTTSGSSMATAVGSVGSIGSGATVIIGSTLPTELASARESSGDEPIIRVFIREDGHNTLELTNIGRAPAFKVRINPLVDRDFEAQFDEVACLDPKDPPALVAASIRRHDADVMNIYTLKHLVRHRAFEDGQPGFDFAWVPLRITYETATGTHYRAEWEVGFDHLDHAQVRVVKPFIEEGGGIEPRSK